MCYVSSFYILYQVERGMFHVIHNMKHQPVIANSLYVICSTKRITCSMSTCSSWHLTFKEQFNLYKGICTYITHSVCTIQEVYCKNVSYICISCCLRFNTVRSELYAKVCQIFCARTCIVLVDGTLHGPQYYVIDAYDAFSHTLYTVCCPTYVVIQCM